MSDSMAHESTRRRGVILLVGVGLVGVIVAGLVLSRDGDDPPTTELTVDWGGSEGHPGCTYDRESGTVDAELTVVGTAARPLMVTVTVVAYADENTSQPVGASSRSVDVDATVDELLHFSFPVENAPHVGEDDVAACSRTVDY